MHTDPGRIQTCTFNLTNLSGIVVDEYENLYVCLTKQNCIIMISSKNEITLPGDYMYRPFLSGIIAGKYDTTGGYADNSYIDPKPFEAKFRHPTGIALGPAYGYPLRKYNLYVCDSCLLYTSPSPRDGLLSRMPSSA